MASQLQPTSTVVFYVFHSFAMMDMGILAIGNKISECIFYSWYTHQIVTYDNLDSEESDL